MNRLEDALRETFGSDLAATGGPTPSGIRRRVRRRRTARATVGAGARSARTARSAALGLPVELARQLLGVPREAAEMIGDLFELAFEPAEPSDEAAIGTVTFRSIARLGAASQEGMAQEPELGSEPVQPAL